MSTPTVSNGVAGKRFAGTVGNFTDVRDGSTYVHHSCSPVLNHCRHTSATSAVVAGAVVVHVTVGDTVPDAVTGPTRYGTSAAASNTYAPSGCATMSTAASDSSPLCTRATRSACVPNGT